MAFRKIVPQIETRHIKVRDHLVKNSTIES